MCGENVRDGSTTKTIPLDQEDCADKNCTTDSEFGMHENYMHYYQCKNRERNQSKKSAISLAYVVYILS